MSLPLPNLDDRDFERLVEEARQQIRQSCPEWTDLSPGDAGMAMVEVFAHLTEVMLYRLNRLPEKAYIAFLRLIGVQLHPPAAASVRLRFSRRHATEQPLEIPRGTRVAARRPDGGVPPVYVTSEALVIPAGEMAGSVLAYHCEVVEAELAGVGTGLPGLVVEAQRPPIVAPTGDERDLIVGVALPSEEVEEQVPVVQHQGQLYRVWREVESFTDVGPEPFVYVADRMTGRIYFAPATRMGLREGGMERVPQALAAVPPAGREIRLWYRRGGGPAGNAAAGTLTVLKAAISGVEVTNPEPATGGQAAETVENALVRGPQELHSLHRAVTARDFELVALYSSRAVARSQALTRAALWAYASPGTVEVLLVPHLPPSSRQRVAAGALQQRETEVVRQQIQNVVDRRRPLGTTCIVNWTRYKTVRVTAHIVVRRHENPLVVRQRVLDRLHGTINPLPTSFSASGWPFGQALRVSHVYDVALAEPGVLWVDRVRLHVDEVPAADVLSIAADRFQPRTWYAGSGALLFRSLDAGDGWEPIGRFPDEQVSGVYTHPQRAGLLAAVTKGGEKEGSRVHISYEAGETWQDTVYTTSFEVNDAAWLLRDEVPMLLLATEAGLYELALRAGASPVQVLVSAEDPDMGFYAVAASEDVWGRVNVAVAAEATGGVFLSSAAGRPNTYEAIGLEGQDVRVLAVQADGPRSFLWAGTAAAGGEPGHGCFRWELRGAEHPPEGWQAFGAKWDGGSCRSLAFTESQVWAATHRAGVLSLDAAAREPVWAMPDVRCGLPLRDPGRFHPVDTVAADPVERLLMAGGVEGVYRSRDGGERYEPASECEFADKVTLPPTWLFCSGRHDVTVEKEDEAERD